MAIMTGVQSAQVLGPTTQKQANKSREAIQEVGDDTSFDASDNVESFDSPAPNSGSQNSGGRTTGYSETDGGRTSARRTTDSTSSGRTSSDVRGSSFGFSVVSDAFTQRCLTDGLRSDRFQRVQQIALPAEVPRRRCAAVVALAVVGVAVLAAVGVGG